MFTKIKKLYALDLLNGKVLDFAKLKLVLINALLFFVPLFIGEPQVVIGTIVNLFLIYIALNFKKCNLLPAIFLPAIATLLRNVLLGPFTLYLAVLMPFIWIANGLFVMLIRMSASKGQSARMDSKRMVMMGTGMDGGVSPGIVGIGGLAIASVSKSLFLFACAFSIISIFKFPPVLLIAMGPLQLLTSGLAGIVFFLYSRNTHFFKKI